jgi:hypothetical protein
MRVRFRDFDPLPVCAKKLIRETEVALLYASRFPERTPCIPTIEVNRGTFRASFAKQFWSATLDLDAPMRD